MRPSRDASRHARPTRLPVAGLLLALCLLLAACGGAEDTATSDDATSDDATADTATEVVTDATEEVTADGLAGSEDPVDPDAEPTDAAAGSVDPVVCEGALSVLQLIGDASNPENDDDQIRDAVELMGQAIGDLEAAGADPVVIEAADAIHEQFATVVDDPTVEPDYAVVEAAGAALRPLVESCGFTPADIEGAASS